MNYKNLYTLLFTLSVLLTGCNGDDENAAPTLAPFSIENDTTISINGVIGSTTLSAFNTIISQNPKTKQLIFKDAPGSEDDETNVKVGARLHELGLSTHVEDNGSIASGAVDLFLAGKQRSLGSNAKVGVHSWSSGSKEGKDFPRDSEEHKLFLDYYKGIGMSQQLAEDFYFFTLEAAPAAEIHWMTATEIERYSITTK